MKGQFILIFFNIFKNKKLKFNIMFCLSHRAIGYRDISTHTMIINPAIPRGLSIHDSQEPAFAKPDFSQMIPFKPKIKYIPGEHPIPGKKIKCYTYFVPAYLHHFLTYHF